MVLARSIALLAATTLFSAFTNAAEASKAQKHEAGRCAIRGHCGKQGFFGSDLPCPDNGLAEEPDAALRKQLVGICGDKWSEGPICCRQEQVRYTSEDGIGDFG